MRAKGVSQNLVLSIVANVGNCLSEHTTRKSQCTGHK